MQTFLPYPDFKKSFEILDYRRLGKQRVEAFQILNILLDRPNKNGKKSNAWVNHTAVNLWRGYEKALQLYYNLCVQEWILRGYKNTMKFEITSDKVEYPHWFGNDKFHASHRSNLLRKNKEFYSKFGWKERDDKPYVWIDNDGHLCEQHSKNSEYAK